MLLTDSLQLLPRMTEIILPDIQQEPGQLPVLRITKAEFSQLLLHIVDVFLILIIKGGQIQKISLLLRCCQMVSLLLDPIRRKQASSSFPAENKR